MPNSFLNQQVTPPASLSSLRPNSTANHDQDHTDQSRSKSHRPRQSTSHQRNPPGMPSDECLQSHPLITRNQMLIQHRHTRRVHNEKDMCLDIQYQQNPRTKTTRFVAQSAHIDHIPVRRSKLVLVSAPTHAPIKSHSIVRPASFRGTVVLTQKNSILAAGIGDIHKFPCAQSFRLTSRAESRQRFQACDLRPLNNIRLYLIQMHNFTAHILIVKNAKIGSSDSKHVPIRLNLH